MGRKNWFELSNEGWRRLNAGRPLGDLLREAIQNAFDHQVQRVSVTLDRQSITIEDDGRRGIGDDRLIYTVFMTDKHDSPLRRGRKGRGLKELISVMDTAVVETVGQTVRFDSDGRQVQPNRRQRGTRLWLQRQSSQPEVEQARRTLRLVIPPKGVSLTVDAQAVSRPRLFATVGPCQLPTVVIRQGAERLIERATELSCYQPRNHRELPHIFEMGIPIQPIRLPWHVDVGQRLPLADGRDRIDDFYRLTVLVNIFEMLVERRLPKESLRDAWVVEVLSQCQVSEAALESFVRRAFGKRAVLGSSSCGNDRARQVGAQVVDIAAMPPGVFSALRQVMCTSDEFVNARLQAEEKVVRAIEPHQKRAIALYEHLCRVLAGRKVSVRLMRKPPNLEGRVDHGSFDRRRLELKLNLLGDLDLEKPLSPRSLGIIFHELAHLSAEEHDFRFIEELQRVAGQAAALLTKEGRELVERFGVGG